MTKTILFFLSLFFTLTCLAQDAETDSLKKVIEQSPDDTTKVNNYILLSRKFINTNPDGSIGFTNLAIRLAKDLKFKRGEAVALKIKGIAFYTKSLYVESINYWLESMAIFDTLKDKAGVANIQSNISMVYNTQGDDGKALEYLFSALKTAEEINDSLRMATVCTNIAVVYQKKERTQNKAVDFYKRALAIGEKIHDDDIIGSTTVGLGEFYMNMKEPKLDSALYYTFKSLDAYKRTYQAPYSLNNLGQIYNKLNQFDKSIFYLNDAYNLAKSYQSQNDMALALVSIYKTYTKKNDINLALQALKQAEPLAKESKNEYCLKDIYEGQATLYAKKHDYSNAYKYQYLLLGIKDTIYNIEADKKLQGVQFAFDIAKKESQIGQMTKDKEIQQQELRRQKMVKNSFVGGFAVVLLFAGIFFNQRNKISKEKKRSDELLLNILPSETAEELKATGTAKTKSFEMVSVMFTDFKNFTQASELLSPEELVQEINHCYSEFDRIVTKYGIEKIKTIGDAYMCAGGLPVANNTHPFDVIRAGLEFQEFIAVNKAERSAKGQPFFELRLGIHTGPVVAGIVGTKKFAYDIWGDTVNTASRMESSGAVGKVNISGTTYELVKDKFNCIHRGKVAAKNKGDIDMYFVEFEILS